MPTCIPQAFGVPALSGPPQWWSTSGPAPQINPQLDDPRWVGSLGHGHPTVGAAGGAGEHVLFRALHDSTALYLQWMVKRDTSPQAGEDMIHVGFSPGGGGNPNTIIRIVLNIGTQVQATTDFTFEIFTRNSAGNATGAGATPAWLAGPGNTARVWVLPNPLVRWAVALRIPITTTTNLNNGLQLGTDFRMWYQVTVVEPSAGAIAYPWPPTAAEITTDPTTLQDVYPNPASWGQIHLASGGADPVCAGTAAVTLGVLDIGTTNTPPHRINVDLVNTPVQPRLNTFFARPVNLTGSVIPANTIKATFRLANWGSQPDWNQVAAGVNLWEAIRGGSSVSHSSSIASGAQGNLSFTWNVGEPPHQQEALDFRSPPTPPRKRLHQCMLVELSGPLTFANTSVYRNMDFQHASVVENEDVEISVAGLQPLPESSYRAVYLFIERRNMPRKILQTSTSRRIVLARKKLMDQILELRDGDFTTVEWERFIPRLRNIPVSSVQKMILQSELRPRNWSGLKDHLGQIPVERLIASEVAIREFRPIPTLDTLVRSVPTFRVHAFYETGQIIRIKGRNYPVLRAMTSFGYMVGFDESLRGWSFELAADGIQRIDPRCYRLNVRNGGSARLALRIIADEGS